MRPNETHNKFSGTCCLSSKYEHEKKDCWNIPENKKNSEQAFTVVEHGSEGWLLDSGASSRMCLTQDEVVTIRSHNRSVGISIANGETLMAVGVQTVCVILKYKSRIRIEEMFYVQS